MSQSKLTILEALEKFSLSEFVVTTTLVHFLFVPDWPGVAALFVGLANYAYKRFEERLFKNKTETLGLVASLHSQVNELAFQMSLQKPLHDELVKQSDELKRLISTANVAQAFKRQ